MFCMITKWTFFILDSLLDSDIGGPIFEEGENRIDLIRNMILSVPKIVSRRPISILLRVTDQETVNALKNLNYQCSMGSGYFLLDLDKLPPARIWDEVLHRDQRKTIRNQDRLNVETKITPVTEDFETSYTLYRETMERRVYRIHEDTFFRVIHAEFQDSFRMVQVKIDGKLVEALSFVLEANTTIGSCLLAIRN